MSKRISLALSFALTLGLGQLAHADDTEILVGAILDPGSPNVLFMIDTSGSMTSEVIIGDDYDPTVTYTGNCDINRLYWSIDSSNQVSIPNCNQGFWINTEAMRCQAALDVIATNGRYRDRFAQFDAAVEPNAWSLVVLSNAGAGTQGRDRLTECASDFGVHGDVGGDALFPANGEAGPWTTDEMLAVDWRNTGNTYSFYSGNFLNWIQERGKENTISTRIAVVQKVLRNVITPLTGINTSLMRFSVNSQGGMVLHEMAPNEDNVESFVQSVDSMTAQGTTPLAETLYEARQYYSGGNVEYGLDSTDENGPQPSVPESRNGNNYLSPVDLQCQRNYVVILTDGLPADDTEGDSLIEGLPGFSQNQGTCTESCLDELAQYLFEVDQVPGLPGVQNISTFTIGFLTEQALLEATATGRVPRRDDNGELVLDQNGDPITDPGYFVANDDTSLAFAFDNILSSIQTEAESFSSPSLSVDTQNRLTNREDIYLAMFQPPGQTEPHWEGNLKKYRIGRAAGAETGSTPTIVDANGQAAVDESGVFVDGARSFWSLSADGGEIAEGGFRTTLTTNRKVVTDIAGSNLLADGNRVIEGNDELTADLLQVAEDRRDAVIRWARGIDANNEARQIVGDPLHSEPTLVAYSNDQYALYFGTNDGILHALDPEPANAGASNLEHFAFIPSELLPRLDKLARNEPQAFGTPRTYGLDGDLTVWIDETNNNGIVESGEKAYLFVGMRRGGRNYYALDITQFNSPKLLWKIRGGQGQFAELGQTWSAPTVARVPVGNDTKTVLLFAGGNDPNQDAKNRPATSDDMGRAVYMVDAETGQRIWWASIRDEADLTLPQMTHSIPSDLRVLDTDQDGTDDRIYVGDTAAKVWRFDIDDDGNITGNVFADLGGDGESGNRKIYYPPSVTRIIDDESGSFLTISVGTGHRAHPLENDVDDGFAMLRDPHPFAPPRDPQTDLVDYPDPIEPVDLLDVTNLADPTTDQLQGRAGWYIRFDAKEKNLSAPLAVLNRIYFTTYTPTAVAASCAPTAVTGNGRLYAVDILTGRPVTYFDQPAPDDRYTELSQTGIPPSPSLVFTEPPCDACDPSDQEVSEITMLIGTEIVDPLIDNRPRPTYWVQEDIDR